VQKGHYFKEHYYVQLVGLSANGSTAVRGSDPSTFENHTSVGTVFASHLLAMRKGGPISLISDTYYMWHTSVTSCCMPALFNSIKMTFM
jgi:hypothetical protein